MPVETLTLNDLQLSAVGEIANIGIGHATTALAEMTMVPFTMDCPVIDSMKLEHVVELIGGDALAACVFMAIEGDVTGYIAFMLPWRDAQQLWTRLLGSAPESPEAVDELAGSTMVEIGNIINSSFLNAIADMAGLCIHATPPLFAVDMTGSLVSAVAAEAEMGEVVVLAMQTRIHSTDSPPMEGFFLAIPSVDGIKRLFAGLGIL